MPLNRPELLITLRPEPGLRPSLRTSWCWDGPVLVRYNPYDIPEKFLPSLVRAEVFRYRCYVDICPFDGDHARHIVKSVNDVLNAARDLPPLSEGGYRAIRMLLPDLLAAHQARQVGEDLSVWRQVIRASTSIRSLESRARHLTLEDGQDPIIAQVLTNAQEWKRWPQMAAELTRLFLDRERKHSNLIKKLLNRGRGRPGKAGESEDEDSFSADPMVSDLLDALDATSKPPLVRSVALGTSWKMGIGQKAWRPGQQMMFALFPDIHTGRPIIPASPIYALDIPMQSGHGDPQYSVEIPAVLAAVDVSRSMGLPEDRVSAFYIPVLCWVRRLMRELPSPMALVMFAGKALHHSWVSSPDRREMQALLLQRPNMGNTRFPLSTLQSIAKTGPDGWRMLLISDLDWEITGKGDPGKAFLIELAKQDKLNIILTQTPESNRSDTAEYRAELAQAGARFLEVASPQALLDIHLEAVFG